MNTDERDVKRLVARLRKLGRPAAWGRASARYNHMGAKLADAVLQRAVTYEVFVRPRVDRIARVYPTGKTTSGFRALLRSEHPTKVLDVKGGSKPRTIVELAQFFVDRDVETTKDLRQWLKVARNPPSLMTVHGVGPKTVNFLKLLVGLDAIAVDRQILRFVQAAGVDLTDPDLVEAILTKAGKRLGLSGAQVDQLVWRSLAAPASRSQSHATRPKTR